MANGKPVLDFTPDGRKSNRRLLTVIMGAVAVWGGVLSLGALLFGYNESTGEIALAPNVLRGLIVFGCVAIFLGGWALLLFGKRRA